VIIYHVKEYPPNPPTGEEVLIQGNGFACAAAFASYRHRGLDLPAVVAMQITGNSHAVVMHSTRAEWSVGMKIEVEE
jgi:hypothetical protein